MIHPFQHRNPTGLKVALPRLPRPTGSCTANIARNLITPTVIVSALGLTKELRRELKDLKKSISNPSTPVKPRPWRTGSAPRQGQTSDIDDLRAQLDTAQQQMSTPTKSTTAMPSKRPWPDDVKKLQFIHKLTASDTSKTAKVTKR